MGEYAPDGTVKGPTGSAALKIHGNGYHQLIRLPFKGKMGTKHTVSVFARSEKPVSLTLRIGPPSEVLYRGQWTKSFGLTPQWKRYSHTVDLPFHADGFYILELYVKTTDELWLDGVMVEVGDQLSEFQRAAPVELTFVPSSVQNSHHVFFPDEDFAIQAGLLGRAPAGPQLKVSIDPFHYTGYEGKNEFSFRIPNENQRQMPIKIPAKDLDLPEFGTFYLTAQVIDKKGKTLSRLNETVIHRVRRPRFWGKLAEGSPFGVHVAPNEGTIATAKRLGFNWVRSFHMGWEPLQPNEGDAFDWRILDQLIGWYRDHHLVVLGVLGHTPIWPIQQQKTHPQVIVIVCFVYGMINWLNG